MPVGIAFHNMRVDSISVMDSIVIDNCLLVLRSLRLIKTDKRTKERILIILNFLINQGSSKAYLMREAIL